MQRFRGGLVFKAHEPVYHSTLGLRVMKKKKRRCTCQPAPHPSALGFGVLCLGFRVWGLPPKPTRKVMSSRRLVEDMRRVVTGCEPHLTRRAERDPRRMRSGVEIGALREVPQHPRTQTEPCNTPLNPRRRLSNKYCSHLTTREANNRLHPGKGQREILRVEERCWVQAHDMSFLWHGHGHSSLCECV